MDNEVVEIVGQEDSNAVDKNVDEDEHSLVSSEDLSFVQNATNSSKADESGNAAEIEESSDSAEKPHLPWIPVNSDDECIPRIRTASSSSFSDEEESANNPSTSSAACKNYKGNGKTRSWQKEPLSIMWCLKSFDEDSDAQNSSRVVLYDKKTVMALENGEAQIPAKKSSPKKVYHKKKRKKRLVHSGKKPSKIPPQEKTEEEEKCHSCCESIDSSPSSYKNDLIWSGFKIKKKWKPQPDNESDVECLD